MLVEAIEEAQPASDAAGLRGGCARTGEYPVAGGGLGERALRMAETLLEGEFYDEAQQWYRAAEELLGEERRGDSVVRARVATGYGEIA